MQMMSSLRILAFSVFGAGAVLTGSTAAQCAEQLYVSPIPDDMNVEFLENHIVIDRPSNVVFDFISTPKNTGRWFKDKSGFGMVSWEAVRGSNDKPQQVGDTAIETIAPVPGVTDVPAKVQYTVVALVPGQEWVAVGQRLDSNGKPADTISTIADWSVKPLPNGKSMFIRVFESIRPEAHTPNKRAYAMSAEWSQEVLVGLKKMIENETPKK
jgi:hypothetical protein